MDVATIKGVVDRLAKRNLIRTAPDTTDARRLVLTLTEEREEAVVRNLHVAHSISEETLSTLASRASYARRTAAQDFLIRVSAADIRRLTQSIPHRRGRRRDR